MLVVPARVWRWVRGPSTTYVNPVAAESWSGYLSDSSFLESWSQWFPTLPIMENWSFPSCLCWSCKIPFFFHTLHVILWNLSEIVAYGQIPVERIPPDLTSWLGNFSKWASILFKLVKLDMLRYQVCLVS